MNAMYLGSRRTSNQVFRDPIGTQYDARSLETLRGLHKSVANQLARAVELRMTDFLNKNLSLTGPKAVDAHFVIAHSFSIKSARESSRNEEAGIIVNCRPMPQDFTTKSTLFHSINEAYQDNFIVILAPVEWPDPAKKNDLRATWLDPIRSIIMEEWGKLK